MRPINFHRIKLIFILAAAVTCFNACSKDDDDDPQPTPTITKLYSDMEFDGNFITLSIPEIDQSIYNSAAILVYMNKNFGTDYWEPIPSPEFGNIGYYYKVGEITIYDYTMTGNSNTFNIKVTIIK